jgi:hypothetical protein
VVSVSRAQIYLVKVNLSLSFQHYYVLMFSTTAPLLLLADPPFLHNPPPQVLVPGTPDSTYSFPSQLPHPEPYLPELDSALSDADEIASTFVDPGLQDIPRAGQTWPLTSDRQSGQESGLRNQKRDRSVSVSDSPALPHKRHRPPQTRTHSGQGVASSSADWAEGIDVEKASPDLPIPNRERVRQPKGGLPAIEGYIKPLTPKGLVKGEGRRR